ncbi:hypothetical protein [Nesterenkonia pannonica]|uniref:hypothetical protein n=1 Tax=Nesterenkonia pannonica TaxID=1548602 RepID=UPI0021649222|nr:hypothetical protein [Nesterenkonia pannonica]
MACYLGAYVAVSSAALGHRPLFGSNMGIRRAAWREVRDGVHRSDQEIHDDMDLSFHIGAEHRVAYLRGASVMGMSMRPFYDGRAFMKRFSRGMRTVTIHWPEDFPPRRWTRLLRQGRPDDPAAADRRVDDGPLPAPAGDLRRDRR